MKPGRLGVDPLDGFAPPAEHESGVSPDLKLQTRNSKPETPNPKLQTRNSKPETPNPKLQTRNPNASPSSLTTLESRFEEVMHDLRRRIESEGGLEVGSRRRLEEEMRLFGARMGERLDVLRSADERDREALASARSLLSIDALARLGARGLLRRRSLVVDAFGYEEAASRRIEPLVGFLFDRWFRVEVSGVESVPSDGPAILVANHSGAIPFDGLMISAAVRRRHARRRDVRWLVEDEAYYFPFFGTTMARIGAVRACPENAMLLLDRGAVVAVFPEGSLGLRKTFGERYRLRRFGRGGAIKLALRSGAPVIPVAVVGGEETYPVLARTTLLAETLGVPFLPITPTFPLLGLFGLLPLPSRWRIQFGPPVGMEGGAQAAEDPAAVSRLNERLRGRIQGMVGELLGRRNAVFR